MIRPISAEDLSRLLADGDDAPDSPRGTVHVFDLRDAAAFTAGHIPGARHTPASHVMRWIPQRALTQELVVLVDEAGDVSGAARHAAHELAHRWFRRVRYLSGGFDAWLASGGQAAEGGPVNTDAGSHDGATEAFQSSGDVPWRTSARPATPDPTRVGR